MGNQDGIGSLLCPGCRSRSFPFPRHLRTGHLKEADKHGNICHHALVTHDLLFQHGFLVYFCSAFLSVSVFSTLVLIRSLIQDMTSDF